MVDGNSAVVSLMFPLIRFPSEARGVAAVTEDGRTETARPQCGCSRVQFYFTVTLTHFFFNVSAS